MLSIRRRRGPQEFQEESAFGRPEPGWPGWGELGPILLRSAGIAGIAGVIMVIVAGDALFTEPLRAPRKETQAFVAPAKEVPAAEPAAVDLVAAEPVAAEPAAAEPASAREAAAVANVFDRRAPVAEERSPAEAFAFAAAPAMPAAKPAAVRLELRGNLSPEDSPAPAPAVSAALIEPEGVEAAAPPVADLDAKHVPVADADPVEAGEAALSAADPIEVVAAPSSTAALRETDAAALSAADPRDDDASAAATEGTAPWAEEALVCPRDWLEMSDTASAGEAPAGCGPKFVLVAPVPSAATEAPEEPTLDETLESAAATHALKLVGFVARLPIPRPDPPPVRRVSRNHRADWPAESPPNCGDKHAYWRFVDRKAGTKEWYCR